MSITGWALVVRVKSKLPILCFWLVASIHFFYIQKYSVDIPFMDEWSMIHSGALGKTITFDWLMARVIANGGTLTLGKGLSASGTCSAFRAMSRRLFHRHKSPPSFYALRHAACAELKASGAGAQEVAQGMGHASELSQKVYGLRSQGSGSYAIHATASAPVRGANRPFQPPSACRTMFASNVTSSLKTPAQPGSRM